MEKKMENEMETGIIASNLPCMEKNSPNATTERHLLQLVGLCSPTSSLEFVTITLFGAYTRKNRYLLCHIIPHTCSGSQELCSGVLKDSVAMSDVFRFLPLEAKRLPRNLQISPICELL